jgi:hypothetical protein
MLGTCGVVSCAESDKISTEAAILNPIFCRVSKSLKVASSHTKPRRSWNRSGIGPTKNMISAQGTTNAKHSPPFFSPPTRPKSGIHNPRSTRVGVNKGRRRESRGKQRCAHSPVLARQQTCLCLSCALCPVSRLIRACVCVRAVIPWVDSEGGGWLEAAAGPAFFVFCPEE